MPAVALGAHPHTVERGVHRRRNYQHRGAIVNRTKSCG
jgi:hypothetical protein